MKKKKREGILRIVSLARSATSILCAVGAKGPLVGVTKWCPLVAPVNGLPELGDCWSLDPAEVLKLKPTLVIGSVPYKQETVAKLLEQPLTFLAMNPRSLADIESDILLLGRITARERAARKLAAGMRKAFAQIKVQAFRARPLAGTQGKPRVYCEAWPNPRISSPPWVDELVRIAGGRMVVPPGARVTDAEVAAA